MLNINRYEIKATYIPTKRKRKVTVKARNEEDAIANLGPDYTDVVSVTLQVRPPSERQIAYATALGITITEDMCLEDVKCLISAKTDDKKPPNEGLKEFADAHGIIFSNYVGKKRLYNSIFTQLPQRDTIAFFIFSVYRYLSDDREANLDKSSYKDVFYSFADDYIQDKKFTKSLEDNYRGEDLRFFGSLRIIDTGWESYQYGGTTNAYAFRCAKQFLKDKHLIDEKVKTSRILKISSPQKPQSPQDPVNTDGRGCMLPILVVFMFIGALSILL